MEIILPFNTNERQNFIASAIEVGFHDYYAYKFIYLMQDSDLDVFQLMCEERLSLLIYGWEICDEYLQKFETLDSMAKMPANLKTVIKRLTYHTLEIWFSKEWELCKPARKVGLFYCLSRAKSLFTSLFALLDWDYLLQFEMKPWRVPHLCIFFTDMKATRELQITPGSIEFVESAATSDDVAYLKAEGLALVLLRLIKLFDAGSIEVVQYMAIRMVATWNRICAEVKRPFSIDAEQKCCLVFICHVYLVTVYELDDSRGFVIDNMMNNIRFYSANMHGVPASAITGTAAYHIAKAFSQLQMNSYDFFEAFICNKFDDNSTTPFGVSSHAYLSYVLGNMLNRISSLNEEDFAANLGEFKRILGLYVAERERSERFMQNELTKQERQRSSNSNPLTVKDICDFKGKFCKGNRLTNIGNSFENADESEGAELTELNKQCVRQSDPVFQNIPNNTNILNYVYNVLAERPHKGWYLAKLVLLLKIIGHQLNEIETWRYHPGLTTQFMLNLETKLSRYYRDFARIFEEHHFIEQEFWLTAFYLNPILSNYKRVLRCGIRTNRRRHTGGTGEDGEEQTPKSERMEKSDKSVPNVKYGLLSSTFDVRTILEQTNVESPDLDYGPLHNMLRSMGLPPNIVKDLLIVSFVPRNKGFAWAVNWDELRKRCRMLLKSDAHKRRLVGLNMAEACDQLKFLKIDYDKYKNRPQLDYGAIELGYEGKMNFATNFPVESDDDEDDDDDEEDYDEFEDMSKRARLREERVEEELPEECFVGTRRTRARTAAVIASVAINKRLEESRKAEEEEAKEELKFQKLRAGEIDTDEEATSEIDANVVKCELKDWLEEHQTFQNATEGFKPFPNIWDFDEAKVQADVESTEGFFETKSITIYEKFLKLAAAKSKVEELEKKIMIPSNVGAVKPKIEANESHQRQEQVASTSKLLVSKMEFTESTLKEEKREGDKFYDDLIKQCLAKKLQITLTRLTVADIAQLRQPKVCVKRLDMVANKGRCGREVGDVSNMSSAKSLIELPQSTSNETARPIRKRKPAPKSKRQLQSYSSESSTDVDETKLKRFATKRRARRPKVKVNAQPIDAPQCDSLYQAPYNASGLKLCNDSCNSENSGNGLGGLEPAAIISNNSIELFDFIQISSSASLDESSALGYLSPVLETVMSTVTNTEDPLYEEEILI